jgi:hypothetical protein
MMNYDVWLNTCLGCDKCKGLYATMEGDSLYVELKGVLYTPLKDRLERSIFYDNILDAGTKIKPVKNKEELKEVLRKGYKYAE